MDWRWTSSSAHQVGGAYTSKFPSYKCLIDSHIFVYQTPSLGLSADLLSDVKQGFDAENASDKPKPIGWLRTMIGFDKTLTHQWAADCQGDWLSVTLGLAGSALSQSGMVSPWGLLILFCGLCLPRRAISPSTPGEAIMYLALR